jgi:hypothetical protein
MQDGVERRRPRRPLSRPRQRRALIVNFKLADGPDQDGRISKREFKKACKKGLVKYPFR